MTIVTKVTGSTLNKSVKEKIKELFPSITGLVKKHVPGVGYTFFIKEGEKTIGKVFAEFGYMVIYKD